MKRINNANDFEFLFDTTFGDIDKRSLSEAKDKKLRITLGGEGNDSLRVEQAFIRSIKILQYCFSSKSILLRMILWSKNEEKNLEHAGFQLKKADKVLRRKDDDEILYAHFNTFSRIVLSPIIKSIINFEMAEEPSANITCYFVSFNSELIINVYDDRGVDVYSPNIELLNKIKAKFFDWLI